MKQKLFLLDAMALIYRAYYALMRSPRHTSYGKNTNAQFGFTLTLCDLIEKEQPSHMAVCFDTQAPTERHLDFADYKANREAPPEDLIGSLDDIKSIIKGFGIPVIELDGFEADDIIGTLAWQAVDRDFEVFMVTPDKDYGQLLSKPDLYIYKPGSHGSGSEILDASKICEKWGIQRVEQVIDMIGLMGDAADNIPGIFGIGQKTASKLLTQYDTLENILANVNKLTGSVGAKIRAGLDSAVLSKKLAKIIIDVPVIFNETEFKLEAIDKEKLSVLFSELEFKGLGKKILGTDFQIKPNRSSSAVDNVSKQIDLFSQTAATASSNSFSLDESSSPVSEDASIFHTIEDTDHNYQVVSLKDDIIDLCNILLSKKEICFDTETTGIDPNSASLVGLSFSYKSHEAYYIPCYPEDLDKTSRILDLFDPLFQKEDLLWIGQNLKFDLLMLSWHKKKIKGPVYDTMLAYYVIDPEGKKNMDTLSEHYLNYSPVPIEKLIGKKGAGQKTMDQIPLQEIKEYAAEDADITFQLKEALVPLVVNNKVDFVLDTIENPLVPVLVAMEYEGVKIDSDFLRDYSKVLETEEIQRKMNVFQEAGLEFNLASPKQLGEVLFEKMKLDPHAKKTKSGQYATGEEVLRKMANKFSIVNDILAYRELSKLRSTYVDALPLLINKHSGRIHTSFSQAVVVTGRLSSSNPNLQNIPVRTALGKEIRKAFIPTDKDHIILSADYSQIELRIVAAISSDENMIRAFKDGKDIHRATAAHIYGIREEDVSKEERYKAKSVNFGIIYGQSAFGLAENLGISRFEAKNIIESYKREFSGIESYMARSVQFAKEHGYVETLTGRKRWLKDINSSNFTVRSFAERNAINSPIQGTAADMIKLAMIKIYNEINKYKLKSKMIIQVHDELVFDAVISEQEALSEIINRNMTTALPLPNGVPVSVSVGYGENWLEAH